MKLIRDHKTGIDVANCLQDVETWETFKGDSIFECVSSSSTGRARMKISERSSTERSLIVAKGSKLLSRLCVGSCACD